MLFARGFLADAVRAVATCVVEGASKDAVRCELAVLQKPDRPETARAFAALEPGGTCYSEWSGLLPGAPARIRARLEREGFAGVRLYWMLPTADSARAWFEACSAKPGYRKIVRGIIAHYVSHSGATGLLPFVLDAAFALDLFPAICATCYKPGPGANHDTHAPLEFPGWLTASIADRAGIPAGDLVLVMRAGGEFVENKVSWLAYAWREQKLQWVAKVPRKASVAGAIRREHDALTRLACGEKPIRAVDVPGVLLYEEIDGFPVLVQTALDGTSLNALARSGDYAELSRRFGSALAEFAGRPDVTPVEVWWPRLIEPWLERFAAALDVLGDDALAPAVRSVLTGLGPLPLVWAHNDCTPWNAVIVDGRLGLYDWEDGTENGLPLVDLVYLLANTAFVADRTVGHAESVGTYRRLLDSSDPHGAAFLGSLNDYAATVGFQADDVARLRIATWLAHTTQDLEILIAGTDSPSPGLLADSVCLPILRAELEALGSPSGPLG